MGFEATRLQSSRPVDPTDNPNFLRDGKGRLRAVPSRVTGIRWNTDEWSARWWAVNWMRKNWLLRSRHRDLLKFDRRTVRPRYTPPDSLTAPPDVSEMGEWATNLHRMVQRLYSDAIKGWDHRGLLSDDKARRMMRCTPAMVMTDRLQRSCNEKICPHCTYRRHLLLIRQLVRLVNKRYDRRKGPKPWFVLINYFETIPVTNSVAFDLKNKLHELNRSKRIVRRLCDAANVTDGIVLTDVRPDIILGEDSKREHARVKKLYEDYADEIAHRRATGEPCPVVPNRTFGDYEFKIAVQVSVLGFSPDVSQWQAKKKDRWHFVENHQRPTQRQVITMINRAHPFPYQTLAPVPDSVARALLAAQYHWASPLGEWKEKLDLKPSQGKFPKPLPPKRKRVSGRRRRTGPASASSARTTSA